MFKRLFVCFTPLCVQRYIIVWLVLFDTSPNISDKLKHVFFENSNHNDFYKDKVKFSNGHAFNYELKRKTNNNIFERPSKLRTTFFFQPLFMTVTFLFWHSIVIVIFPPRTELICLFIMVFNSYAATKIFRRNYGMSIGLLGLTRKQHVFPTRKFVRLAVFLKWQIYSTKEFESTTSYYWPGVSKKQLPKKNLTLGCLKNS